MISQAEDFERFLRLLDNENCLKDVMVIGSWAEYLYKTTGLLKGFDPNLKTLDIDFLVRNLRKPQPPINVLTAARSAGYIPVADYMDEVTKIYSDSGLEIEFLIGKRGAGRESSLKTNIGVTAQALWHLDVLSENPTMVTWHDMDVIVPQPEAYTLHKMIINSERGEKSKKDAAAIEGLWPYVDRTRLDSISCNLSKRDRAKVSNYIKNHRLI